MGSLADSIEEYIKQLLREAARDIVEIQRSELARRFGCVPSQINYVLSTRFTVEKGYIVESRRGGGGYIRVIKVERNFVPDLNQAVSREIGDAIGEDDAMELLLRLEDLNIINQSERLCVKAILARETSGLPREMSDVLRARLLKGLLAIILRR